MATAEQFFEWLKSSGCEVTRPGIYAPAWDDLWLAFDHFAKTGQNTLRHLDLLTTSIWLDDGLCLTPEDCLLLRQVEAGETPWNPKLPVDVQALVDWSEADHERRQTYAYRRQVASIHISRPEVRRRIFKRDGGKCRECEATTQLSVDHVVAVINGGGNDDDNLQALCRRCNSSKGGR